MEQFQESRIGYYHIYLETIVLVTYHVMIQQCDP